MTKEQQVTKQSLFENGTADYAPPAHLIEQYKAGNCPLGDVQASIESIMEKYAKEKAIEFEKWRRENNFKKISEETFSIPIILENPEYLYQRFMKSKEPKQ